MEFLGKQIFVEFYDCDESHLNDSNYIGLHMVEAAKHANATVVQQFFHEFSPYGVSGTVIIAESHINIHTWPEYGYAAVDIFSCGDSLNPFEAIEYLRSKLKAKKVETNTINRGALKHIAALKE